MTTVFITNYPEKNSQIQGSQLIKNDVFSFKRTKQLGDSSLSLKDLLQKFESGRIQMDF
jgi:hypothetical protein